MPFQQVANRNPRASGIITLSVGLLVLLIAIALIKTIPGGGIWTTAFTEEVRAVPAVGARALGRGVAIVCLVFYSSVYSVTGLLNILLGQTCYRLFYAAYDAETFRRVPMFMRACLTGLCALVWVAGWFWLMLLMLRLLARMG